MNIISRLSIKARTYLLVMLSVVVALVLSFVSSNGLNSIRDELSGMVFATKIERYTSKLIIEEQNYRLNANGSVYNFAAANQAYERAMQYVNEIYALLLQRSDKHKIESIQQELNNIHESTNAYRTLYLKGVSLLTELNRKASTLESEGENITRHIQQYVEAKRVEIKQSLNQKTVEKINNGSNIWQYTYVTRLEEKKYRLSPNASVLDAFNKDYTFMMNEWSRLKRMSDQTYEYEKLEEFNKAAKKYQQAMLAWVNLNRQLVSDVLPEMRQFGNNIIMNAVRSAEESIQRVSREQRNISLVLIIVTGITIVLGVLFGALIARSISSVVSSFQNGLLNFFQYLNHQKETVRPIEVRGHDEISTMAEVVNENIYKIQKVIERKEDYQQALLEWSKVDYQNENLTIQKATELSAKALHVERVSIWLFNEEQTELKCEDLFNVQDNTHLSGDVLTERLYPIYFKLIREGKMLVVDEAQQDPRTREFVNDYFKPLNILSVLDMPIVLDNQLLGVIRHEKIAELKSWQPDEREFVYSILNAISLSLEIKKRRLIQEELKAQKEILHHNAHHDALTNLPNRVLFNDRLKQSIKQAQRNDDFIAVLFIDLDHFKGINDSMGHKVGDELLIEVARRLKSSIRQTDTLARLGGDEFTVILDQVQNTDAIVAITQGLLKVMNDPVEISGHSFYISLSIGVAIYPEDGETVDELLKNADAAMYQAKDDGRNTYQFYTQIMTEKAFERVAMEASFRNALSHEEFEVYYQPQVDGRTGDYIGMEALIRWNHPDMGLITPANFLSFAEDTGLIIPLDLWAMRKAMTQITQWYQAGLKPGVLALNLSIKQLQKDDFLTTLQSILEETGCRPEWLELEVTEGQLIKDGRQAVRILNDIKELGVNLAIDDFGTGYSSLSQLKRLPIDKLKIDQSFIRDLPGDEEDSVISKSVIALSINMGLSVIAEGVERQEQRDFLLENGCYYMQGYFYGKPVPAEEMETKLKQFS